MYATRAARAHHRQQRPHRRPRRRPATPAAITVDAAHARTVTTAQHTHTRPGARPSHMTTTRKQILSHSLPTHPQPGVIGDAATA